jgi:uncharacterized membrane protein
MRKRAANVFKSKTIEWRSHEPSRLETFSDAVFAFAVTLIIVSLEVPKSFTELYETMKGTLSFAACFAILFNIWNSQNLFFRRFGLNDRLTVILNGMLLFVVLVYAYPLKFLFGLLFFDNTYTMHGQNYLMITDRQTPVLLTIYGAGYTAIYLLFFFLYANAKKQADKINLNARELFQTQTLTYINLIGASVGLCAIALAWLLPLEFSGLSGFTYFAIPIAFFIYFTVRGRKARRIFEVNAPQLS